MLLSQPDLIIVCALQRILVISIYYGFFPVVVEFTAGFVTTQRELLISRRDLLSQNICRSLKAENSKIRKSLLTTNIFIQQ